MMNTKIPLDGALAPLSFDARRAQQLAQRGTAVVEPQTSAAQPLQQPSSTVTATMALALCMEAGCSGV